MSFAPSTLGNKQMFNELLDISCRSSYPVNLHAGLQSNPYGIVTH